jgi:Holliday junction resolvasome RuvABC endonuclease subunit
MRPVLGIDPSLSATGLARTDGATLTISRGQGDDRLEAIYDQVMEAAFGAELAMVEDLPTHAHGAGKTGMAQGVVRLALVGRDVPYVLVVASKLNVFATGDGRAGKGAMAIALAERTGLVLGDDNQVDAWWLREMGCHLLGDPTVALPATHTRALKTVAPRMPAVPR